MAWQLAQVNTARAKYGRFDSRMKAFFDAVEHMNRLAEQSPGFVWRLKDESTDATAAQAFPDRSVLVTLSVWTDVASLKAFTYDTMHRTYLRRRTEWFDKPDGPGMALWWVPTGHRPTLAEAKGRMARLASIGGSVEAFTFSSDFPPPTEA